VWDIINLTSTDIVESKVLKMVKRAEVTLESELGVSIDYADCTDGQKAFIENLAAIYAICFLTGGSAVGLSFKVGDQDVTVLDKVPPLDVLQEETKRLLEGLREVYVGSA
jgi:hypothetical protein